MALKAFRWGFIFAPDHFLFTFAPVFMFAPGIVHLLYNAAWGYVILQKVEIFQHFFVLFFPQKDQKKIWFEKRIIFWKKMFFDRKFFFNLKIFFFRNCYFLSKIDFWAKKSIFEQNNIILLGVTFTCYILVTFTMGVSFRKAKGSSPVDKKQAQTEVLLFRLFVLFVIFRIFGLFRLFGLLDYLC